MNPILICTHDDRPQAQTGLKLLVLSLARHCPGVDVLVSWPTPDATFVSWLDAQPGVQLHVDASFLGRQWNIKPDLLLHCLDRGYQQVIWIDSDVIVARDFRHLLDDADPDTVVVAEDFYWAAHVFPGGTVRTRMWGLTPGRPLSWTANTGVLRVTGAHRPLLQAWKTLLETPAYVRAHQREWTSRPIHMVGDQDVLTALLASERFSRFPVRFLHRGRDVIYNFGPSGYTPRERFANLDGAEPPFVHCSGPKPWEAPGTPSVLRNPKAYYARVGLELADYCRVARDYRGHMEQDAVAFDLTTLAARICCRLAGRRIPLQGLPITLFHGLGRHLRNALGYNLWADVGANLQEGELPDGEAILARESPGQQAYETAEPGTHPAGVSAAPPVHDRQGLMADITSADWQHNRRSILW